MGPGEAETTEAPAYRDIAHPITAEFRHDVQQKVLEAYEYESERAKIRSNLTRNLETSDEAI